MDDDDDMSGGSFPLPVSSPAASALPMADPSPHQPPPVAAPVTAQLPRARGCRPVAAGEREEADLPLSSHREREGADLPSSSRREREGADPSPPPSWSFLRERAGRRRRLGGLRAPWSSPALAGRACAAPARTGRAPASPSPRAREALDGFRDIWVMGGRETGREGELALRCARGSGADSLADDSAAAVAAALPSERLARVKLCGLRQLSDAMAFLPPRQQFKHQGHLRLCRLPSTLAKSHRSWILRLQWCAQRWLETLLSLQSQMLLFTSIGKVQLK